MKQILYGGILLAVFLSACSPQQASQSDLTGTVGTEFTLDDTLGGQTSLSDFDGKPVLLYFHMAVG